MSEPVAKRTLLIGLPFGRPHIELKFEILRNNLRYFATSIPDVFSKIVVELYMYDTNLDLPPDILNIGKRYPGMDLNVVRRKGIVNDFFRLFITPERLRKDKYHFVLLTLDDVEIVNEISFKRLLVTKRLSGAHALMPTLSHDSKNIVYPYMKYDPSANYTGRVISIGEFFAFLFDTKSYISRYYPLLDESNAFGWGMDLIGFEQTGLRILQVNDLIVKHHIQGESYSTVDRNAHGDMVEYLRKRNQTVKKLWESKMVLSVVNMNHLSDSEWERVWNRL